MLKWMSGYLATIWIDVTPLKIYWWPDRDLEKPPLQWDAPPHIAAPPSDPPPQPRPKAHSPVVSPSPVWREGITDAFERLGTPVITVVDEEGYPVPFRVRRGQMRPEGVSLDLFRGMPVEAEGRACLTFHTIEVKDGEMVANENVFFIGDVEMIGDRAIFKVEKQLPSLSAKFGGVRDYMMMLKVIRASSKRARVEAVRRGQSAPKL